MEAICREAAPAEQDATIIFCTNVRGARVAPQAEAATGRPVTNVDTVPWGGLTSVGIDPPAVKGWGRVSEVAP